MYLYIICEIVPDTEAVVLEADDNQDGLEHLDTKPILEEEISTGQRTTRLATIEVACPPQQC